MLASTARCRPLCALALLCNTQHNHRGLLVCRSKHRLKAWVTLCMPGSDTEQNAQLWARASSLMLTLGFFAPSLSLHPIAHLQG